MNGIGLRQVESGPLAFARELFHDLAVEDETHPLERRDAAHVSHDVDGSSGASDLHVLSWDSAVHRELDQRTGGDEGVAVAKAFEPRLPW